MALFVVIFASCHNQYQQPVCDGQYLIRFSAQGYSIPVQLAIENGAWKIINASDTMLLSSEKITSDSLILKTPLFQSYLHVDLSDDNNLRGTWHDLSRAGSYQVNFTIEARPAENLVAANTLDENYDVVFSPGTADSSRAIGSFHVKNGVVDGTFMTESGDYRFLAGEWRSDSMYVSCFDGAHLFYFSAAIDKNKLKNGVFISGNHWRETWKGVANPSAQLQDPDAITTLRDASKPFSFTVRAWSGEEIVFDSSRFNNRVTIVQLFGSWCPNCTDESKLFKDLYEEYKASGLQIIPVAFERLDDIAVAKKTVERQFQEMGITYPAYFGGKSSKEHAAAVFSNLSSVSSYPTSIFIDHTGRVQKIHTGFYGPGTGSAYFIHRERIHSFVDSLVQENNTH